MRGEPNWSDDDPRLAVRGRQDIVILTPVGITFWNAHIAQVNNRAITFLGNPPGEGIRPIYEDDSWPDEWRWILAPMRD